MQERDEMRKRKGEAGKEETRRSAFFRKLEEGTAYQDYPLFLPECHKNKETLSEDADFLKR